MKKATRAKLYNTVDKPLKILYHIIAKDMMGADMKKYRLIASDLDGTLLKNDMTVSEENMTAIEEFEKRGIIFVPTSGRTLYEIPSAVLELPTVRYITYSNGTAIYDKIQKKDIFETRISKETSHAVFKIIQDYAVMLSVHFNGNSYFERSKTSDEEFNNYQVNDYYKEILRKCVMVDNILDFGMSADSVEAIVLFFKDDGEMEECRKRLLEVKGITVTSSVAHNIELCSEFAGKGAGLKALLEILGFSSDGVIAIGDNMNDTSMFDMAELSLCTSNGSENAKALADKVICSNEEHIADYVLKNIL